MNFLPTNNGTKHLTFRRAKHLLAEALCIWSVTEAGGHKDLFVSSKAAMVVCELYMSLTIPTCTLYLCRSVSF